MNTSDKTIAIYRHFNALVKTYDRSVKNSIRTKIVESNKGFVVMIDPSDCRMYLSKYVLPDSDFFWNPDYPDRLSIGNNGDLAVKMTLGLQDQLLSFLEDNLRDTLRLLDKADQEEAERKRLDAIYHKALDRVSGKNDFGEQGDEIRHGLRPSDLFLGDLPRSHQSVLTR